MVPHLLLSTISLSEAPAPRLSPHELNLLTAHGGIQGTDQELVRRILLALVEATRQSLARCILSQPMVNIQPMPPQMGYQAIRPIFGRIYRLITISRAT